MSRELLETPYDLGPGPIDLSRPFLPEGFSPLPYTPSWETLTPPQKLRYNQLHGLYFNEQLVFFEEGLAQAAIAALLREPLPRTLAGALAAFAEEEERHAEMFRRLNRLAARGLYAGRDRRFILVPRPARALLDAAASRPRIFPLFLWVMLFQEERSLHYSRGLMAEGERLEPHFVSAHRWHLADETGHVRHDERLLDLFWRTRPGWLKRANAALLRWSLREFFNAPRRGCLRVLDELGREFPELAPSVPEMRRQVRALEGRRDYHLSLYSREIVPRSFALLDQCPELACLSSVMLGYEPVPSHG